MPIGDVAASSDTGISNTDNITSDNTPTIIGNGATPGDTINLYAPDGTTLLGSAVVDANGSWAITPTSTLPDGNQSLKLTATDPSNNTSAPASVVVTIDTRSNNNIDPTKPVNPSSPDVNATATVVIDAISVDTGVSGLDFITSDNSLIYSGSVVGFTANGEVVKVEIKDVNGVVINTAYVTPVNTVWSWTDTNTQRADGQYTVVATVVDTAGNRVNSAAEGQASQVVTIDTSSQTNPGNGSTPNNVNPADPNTAATLAFSSIGLDSGSSANDFITNDNTLVINGSSAGFTAAGASAGDKVRVQIVDSNNNVIAEHYVTPDSTGAWTFDNTANALADGSYTIKAIVVDAAGNTVNTETSHSLVIDTNQGGTNPGSNPGNSPSTDPNASSATVAIDGITTDSGFSASDFITADGTLSISGSTTGFTATGGSALDKVRVQIVDSLGKVVAETYTDPSSSTGAWTFDNTSAAALLDGNYTIKAAIVDAAGNIVKAATDQALIIDSGHTPTTATLAINSISLDSGVNGLDFITNDNTLTLSGSTEGFTVNGTDKILVQVLKVSDGSVVSSGYATHSRYV